MLAAPAAAADGAIGTNPQWHVPGTPPNGTLEDTDPALWIDASDSPLRPQRAAADVGAVGAQRSAVTSELVGADGRVDLDAALIRIADLEVRARLNTACTVPSPVTSGVRSCAHPRSLHTHTHARPHHDTQLLLPILPPTVPMPRPSDPLHLIPSLTTLAYTCHHVPPPPPPPSLRRCP